MRELTERQRAIVQFIERCISRDARAPTRGEIAAEFGFRSPNAAEAHLRALERKGVLTLKGGTARGIDLSRPKTPATLKLPLLGRVAAGAPILASEHVEDELTLSAALFDRRPDFLLRVRGVSMRDAGILDGDLLAVEQVPTARGGEIVVARVGDDEVTVKYWRPLGDGRVRLAPANPEFAPIDIDPRTTALTLVGRAVGVIRARLSGCD
jgi:repressor LexA